MPLDDIVRTWFFSIHCFSDKGGSWKALESYEHSPKFVEDRLNKLDWSSLK